MEQKSIGFRIPIAIPTPWDGWPGLEIVGVTRVLETISSLPIRGDNQPNHPGERKPDAGHEFDVRSFRPIRNNQPIATPFSVPLLLLYTHT